MLRHSTVGLLLGLALLIAEPVYAYYGRHYGHHSSHYFGYRGYSFGQHGYQYYRYQRHRYYGGHYGYDSGSSAPADTSHNAAKEVRGTSNIAGRKTVGHLVTQNTKLSSKLYTLLPAGVDLPYAASGFEHLGQFVAAVHVSHNLSIPFEELKARMVGSSPESLGKAIHELRPDVNASDEVIKANEQALEDMEKARP